MTELRQAKRYLVVVAAIAAVIPKTLIPAGRSGARP